MAYDELHSWSNVLCWFIFKTLFTYCKLPDININPSQPNEMVKILDAEIGHYSHYNFNEFPYFYIQQLENFQTI